MRREVRADVQRGPVQADVHQQGAEHDGDRRGVDRGQHVRDSEGGGGCAVTATRPGTSLTATNSAQVAASVLAGTADVGFTEGPDLPDGLQEHVVARDRLVLVVPPGHPLGATPYGGRSGRPRRHAPGAA